MIWGRQGTRNASKSSTDPPEERGNTRVAGLMLRDGRSPVVVPAPRLQTGMHGGGGELSLLLTTAVTDRTASLPFVPRPRARRGRSRDGPPRSKHPSPTESRKHRSNRHPTLPPRRCPRAGGRRRGVGRRFPVPGPHRGPRFRTSARESSLRGYGVRGPTTPVCEGRSPPRT